VALLDKITLQNKTKNWNKFKWEHSETHRE